jgi:hypothetical protein
MKYGLQESAVGTAFMAFAGGFLATRKSIAKFRNI